jgi:hypothetical protein
VPRDQPVVGVSPDQGGGAGHEGAPLGRIINVASAHGLTASPYKAAYVRASTA